MGSERVDGDGGSRWQPSALFLGIRRSWGLSGLEPHSGGQWPQRNMPFVAPDNVILEGVVV